MMIWINAKNDHFKKIHVMQNIYDLYSFSCQNMLLSSFSLSVRDMCITLRARAPVSEVCAVAYVWLFIWGCVCVCVCQHISCKGMSRAKQNIWATFHTLRHLLSCPELRPIKSALHTVCQKQLTRCLATFSSAFDLNLMHILQMLWMCCQASMGAMVNNWLCCAYVTSMAFVCMHTYIYIYAFIRCFYEKRLTVLQATHFVSMCVPWTQCFTTEPQECVDVERQHAFVSMQLNEMTEWSFFVFY